MHRSVRIVEAAPGCFAGDRRASKAVEDYRSPRRFACFGASDGAPASWTAPVLWRFAKEDGAQSLQLRPHHGWQFHHHPFTGGLNVEFGLASGDQLSRVGQHLGDFGVVVGGVMVEEEERFHLGLNG